MIFENRSDAGRRLAESLTDHEGPRTLVLGLPRGGVPVAYEVARELKAPLDVFLVRKLGVPGYEELAMGAIASGGVRVLNAETLTHLHIEPEIVEAVTRTQTRELERRQRAYRDDWPAPDVAGKVAILIDDGLATGSSMEAAIRALRALSPEKIVAAVPVAPADTCRALSQYVDEMICVAMPEPFRGVGAWYKDFRQVTDDEVRALLQSSRAGRPTS